MKKVLIPAALLAIGGAAQAQMTIYGLIDMCYGKSIYSDLAADIYPGLPEQKADLHSGGDNGSSECNSTTRFGLKGSTEVTSGVKANFALESGGITSEGRVTYDRLAADYAELQGQPYSAGPFFNRQAWAGLSGSYGEIRVGRQDSVPYQTMGDFDFNGQSNGSSAGGYAGVAPWLPGRQSRSIQYKSPDLSGFAVHVGLRPKGNSQDGDKDVFSISAKYAGGPFAAALATQTKNDSTSQNFTSVAGSYDFGMLKVMGSYADGGDIADGGTGKGYMLGVVAPVAGFNIGAHYANNTDDLADVQSWEFFVNREIFKNTYAYLEGGTWDGKPTAIGLAPGPDKSYSSFAVGIIYVF